MPFWLVSLPLTRGRRDLTWELLQEKTSYGVQLSSNSKLEVPELRVGTLDTLMALSDDLVKINTSVEMIVAKIRRTVADMAGAETVPTLKVEGLPVEGFLTRFKWDEPKFPTRRPLKETMEKIGEIMTHIEDELKVRGAAAAAGRGRIDARSPLRSLSATRAPNCNCGLAACSGRRVLAGHHAPCAHTFPS
jgi:V-type H+-transporting ATPase subunit C